MKAGKLALSLILFTVLIGQAYPVFAVSNASIIEVSVENIYLTQGQENPITIKLRNTGDYKCFNVEAFLISSTPGLNVLVDAQKVYNEIADGKIKAYEPVIFVDQSLPLGTYSLTLTVVYLRSGDIIPSTITVPVSVVVDKAYVPMVKYAGNAGNGFSSGDMDSTSYLFVNNADETLTDVTFSLSSASSAITIIEGETLSISQLSPDMKATLTPTVSVLQGATQGTYTLTATVFYMDENEDRHFQTFSLPLVVDSEKPVQSTKVTLKEITIDENVTPGEEFNVEITIECGGAEAYDIMAVLGSDITGSLSPITPTMLRVGDAEPGESKTATYRMLAKGDISAGQYPLTFSLVYINNKGITATLSETITVQVEGLIEFQLLDAVSLNSPKGQITELEADLLLVGTENVEFVSLEVVEDNVVKRVSGSEEYIGAVDPDSPIPFDVAFKVDSGAPFGEHDLKLQITYRDHLNKMHEATLETKINVIEYVVQNSGNENQGIWGWILSVLGLR